MNKTHYGILAVVMIMTLGIAIVTPNAFALSQSSSQGIAQGVSQEQTGGLILGSPQINIPVNVQVNTQMACVAGTVLCG